MISRLETIDPSTGYLWLVPVLESWKKNRIQAEECAELSAAGGPARALGRRVGGRAGVARWVSLVAVCGFLFSASLHAVPLPTAVNATSVVEKLVALGPRPTGSAAHQQAIQIVRDALAPLAVEVSLSGGSSEPPLATLEALLAGSGEGEILLTAHLDTVAASVGALDDGSGCGVAIAALHDLARTPLSHSVRLVLFDGEEAGLRGSRNWLGELDEEHRERILAVLNLEMVGVRDGRRPVVLPLPAQGARGRQRRPPGWLVHATLRGFEAAGWPAAVADARFPKVSQLLLRLGYGSRGADSQPFSRAGIPAIVLTDFGLWADAGAGHATTVATTVATTATVGIEPLDPARLERWTTATAAVVRRLDGLAGRPRGEESYWALAGRVWLRRDLYWIGFAFWALLLLAQRNPRRATAASSRAASSATASSATASSAAVGRRRFGAIFRFSFLAAIVTAPSLALALLLPAGVLALLPAGHRRWHRARTGLALLPAAALLLVCLLATWRGVIGWWAPPTFALGLVGLALAGLIQPAPPSTQ